MATAGGVPQESSPLEPAPEGGVTSPPKLSSASNPNDELTYRSRTLAQASGGSTAIADGMRDPETKRIMRGVAESYEETARRAKERARLLEMNGLKLSD